MRVLALVDDGGRRYDASWVAEHDPPEPSWQLDSLALRPGLLGRGIGRELIEGGLAPGAQMN